MPPNSSTPDPEQTDLLFRRYAESQDPELRRELIARHSQLAQTVARKFMGLGESPEDLVQEGTMGLISAVDMYDVSRGVQFTTYATHLIEGHIRHYLRDRGKLIRSPAWIQERLTKISKATDALTQELSRAPTAAEIAARVGLPESGVIQALKAHDRTRTTSLDAAPAPDDDGAGPPCSEKLLLAGPEGPPLPIEDRVFLHQALEKLKAIERKVVYHFYYQDLNLTEIARKLGISVNYASYLLRGALRRLREAFEGQARASEEVARAGAPPSLPARAQPTPYTLAGRPPLADPVTNLPTAAYFRERLRQEVVRAQRYPQAFALLLLAHDAAQPGPALAPPAQAHPPPGPQPDLARHFGRLLRRSVRQVDLVAYLGEMRFGLLLPHTGPEAIVLGERLRSRVCSTPAPTQDKPITVSIGLAIFPADAASPEALFQAAELALAQAQAAGGDRVQRQPRTRADRRAPAPAC